MDDTRELVDVGQVDTALLILSIAALLLCGVLAVLGRQGRGPGPVRGAWLTGLAALAFPLWLIYNRIEDHFGLDSVLALLLNLSLFVVVGIGAGLLLRRYWPADAPAVPHPGDGEAQS